MQKLERSIAPTFQHVKASADTTKRMRILGNSGTSGCRKSWDYLPPLLHTSSSTLSCFTTRYRLLHTGYLHVTWYINKLGFTNLTANARRRILFTSFARWYRYTSVQYLSRIPLTVFDDCWQLLSLLRGLSRATNVV